jgi:hypothetical protein
MRISKITTGFVIQTWDAVLKKWISREFVAGDQTDYERDDDGTPVSPNDIWPDMPEPYLPFAMKPPEEIPPSAPRFYVLETIGDIEPQLHGPFPSPEQRDEQAVQLRRQDPGKNNGLFRLDLSANAELSADPYCGSELE